MDDFWGLGNYDAVARLIPGQGRDLVAAAGIRPGQRVLDVGAGAGGATVPAAATGADVVACDPSPRLLELGRAATPSTVDWVPAAASDLPFPDGSFDVVLSCIGAMFDPDQEAAARELLRVTRPGGTIAMANWTPDGAAGRFFGVLGRYLPPPPPGPRPTAWGDPDRVRELLGAGLSTLDIEERLAELDFGGTPAELAEHYVTFFPGAILAAREDPDAVRRDLTTFFTGLRGYEYLLVRGVRSG